MNKQKRFLYLSVFITLVAGILLLSSGIKSPLSPKSEKVLPSKAEMSPTEVYQPQIEPQIVKPPAEAIPAQIVVQFTSNTTQQQRAAYIESIGGTVVQNIDSLDTVVLTVPEEVAQEPLPESPVVEQSEPDYFVAALDDIAPVNDPRYAEQWALPAIGAPEAWTQLPPDAAKVIVAVIDSGICSSHPDLNGRITDGWDFLESDTVPQDDFGHGCSVSGVIAANMNDGIGIAGVAPNAQVMPLRVLNASGVGSYSDVAAAIVYAADHGAQVINLSLGGSNPSSTLEDAVNYAIAKGVIVVAAAGNSGMEGALYPAAYPDVIAVGSVDPDLQHSSFSNYGSQIDIWAPGRDILTTKRDGGYGLVSGTSFAAPYVAGAEVVFMAFHKSLLANGNFLLVGAQNGGSTTVAPSQPATPVATVNTAPTTAIPIPGERLEYTDPYLGMTFSYPSNWIIQPVPYRDFGFRISSPNIELEALGRPTAGGYLAAEVLLMSEDEWNQFILDNPGERSDVLGYQGLKLTGIESETYRYVEWHFYANGRHHILRFVSSLADFEQLMPVAAEIVSSLKLTGIYQEEPLPQSQDLPSGLSWNNPAILLAFPAGPGKIIADYDASTHTGNMDYGLDVCGGDKCSASAYNDMVLAPTTIKLALDTNGYGMPPTSKDYHLFEITYDFGGKLCLGMGHFQITIPGFTQGKTMPQHAQIGRIIDYYINGVKATNHVHMNLYMVPIGQGCEVAANRVAVPFDNTRTDLRGQSLDGQDYHIGTRYTGTNVISTNSQLLMCIAPSAAAAENFNSESALISMGDTGCDGGGLPPLTATPPPTQPPGSHAPYPPSPSSPGNGSPQTSTPQICWVNNGDPDGDPVTFQVSVWGGANAQSPWISSTCWTPPTLPVGNYTWNVRAMDSGGLQSGASNDWTFSINSSASDGVELCDGTNYGSPCKIFTYTSDSTCINLNDTGWSTRAESLRFRGSYANSYDVILYDDNTNNCSRYEARYGQDTTTLGAFNNKITSIQIQKHGPPVPPPSAQFDVYPYWSASAPYATQFHIVNMDGINNCTWNYGDGHTSTTCTQLHPYTYTHAGTYYPSLQVSGSGGSANYTLPNPIVVTDPQPATCPSTIIGWRGEYWTNANLSGVTTLCRDDADPLTFDWGLGSPDSSIPADNFSVRWTKTVYFSGGIYRFNMGHDDGARLFIDDMNTPISGMDKWGTCCVVDSKDIPLSEGNHTLKMEYFENGGAANAKLWWTSLGPGSFSKAGPSDNTTVELQSNAIMLSWNSSASATRYEYCIDTIDNGSCDTGWLSNGMTLLKVVTGLTPGVDYYWQVRSVNNNGTTYADNNVWWKFYTATVKMDNVTITDNLGPAQVGGPSHAGSVTPSAYKYTFNLSDPIQFHIGFVNEFSTDQTFTCDWTVLDPLGRVVPELSDTAVTTLGPGGWGWGRDHFIPMNSLRGDYTFIGKITFNGIVTSKSTTFTVNGSPSVEVYDAFVTNANGYAASMETIPQKSVISDMRNQAAPTFNAGDGIQLYIDAYNDVADNTPASFQWQVVDPLGRDVSELEWSGDLSSPLDHTWWYLSAVIPDHAITGDYTFTGSITYGDRITWRSQIFHVNGSAGLVNDNFGAPITISSVPYSDSRDTWGATTVTTDPTPSCGVGKNSNSVWYKYTTSANGILHVDTFGSNYDTVITIWTGTINSLVEKGCNDDLYNKAQSLLEIPVTARTAYYIEVMDWNTPGGGGLSLNIDFSQAISNDDFDSPLVIDANPPNLKRDTQAATQASDDPALTACNRLPGEASVWYRYVATWDGELQVDTKGSDYDTMLAVWTGTRGNLTSLGCNDDIGNVDGMWDQDSILNIQVIAGTTYYIEAATYAGMIDVNGASATEAENKPDVLNNTSVSSLQERKIEIDKNGGSVMDLQENRDDLLAQFWGGQLQLNAAFKPSPAPQGYYDDTHIVWMYDGFTATTSTGPYSGTLHTSTVVGNTAEFTFDGSQITLWYSKYSNRGDLEVYVDDILKTTIDQHSISRVWQESWTSGDLGTGVHIVRLVHGSGGTVDIDAIEVKTYQTPLPTLLLPKNNYVTNTSMPAFTWNAETDAAQYEIVFATDSDFTQNVDRHFVTDPTFTFETQLPDGKYYWRVCAYNIDDQPGNWSTSRHFVINTLSPASPVLQLPIDNASVRSVPVFRWNAVSSAVLYQFELDNDSDFSSPLVSINQRTTSRKPAGGLRGTYFWRVRAQDAAGNWSEWSEVFTVNILRSRR